MLVVGISCRKITEEIFCNIFVVIFLNILAEELIHTYFTENANKQTGKQATASYSIRSLALMISLQGEGDVLHEAVDGLGDRDHVLH